jgi:hypothetical protein
MYAPYLPTKLGSIFAVNVHTYSSTMEHMGYGLMDFEDGSHHPQVEYGRMVESPDDQH